MARKQRLAAGLHVLFYMRQLSYLFYFDTLIEELVRRGHRVTILYERQQGGEAYERLLKYHPGITVLQAHRRTKNLWARPLRQLRHFRDFVRYWDPAFRDAHLLRERTAQALREMGWPWTAIAGTARGLGLVPMLQRLLAAIERAVPPFPEITRFLGLKKVDLLLVTPLVYAGSEQVDYVRAARKKGIPSGLCVASWDNLTNKGLMRIQPDRVFVWNEMQKDEAVRLHGTPPEAVVVTGAQNFDHWFTWRPSTTREAFCERWSLDPARPIVLFLGSSPQITADDVGLVRRWLAGVRGSRYDLLREANILIRPHPKQDVWRTGAWDASPRTSVMTSDQPDTQAARAAFYDALHHSALVVGVNTSAMIEAAIVGRPVFTVRMPGAVEAQDGTLHFRHMTSMAGGVLHSAETLDDHARQLADELVSPSPPGATRAFVEAFVRPRGLDTPATSVLADAVEKLFDVHPPPIPPLTPYEQRLQRLMQAWVDREQARVLRAVGGAPKGEAGEEG